MNTLTKSNPLRGFIVAGLFSALAFSFGAAATASDAVESHSMVVPYGDLNVASPKGAATLYTRIVAAAHEVCDAPGERSFEYRAQQRICLHDAIADAVTKVGREQLIAIYNAKNRQPLPVALAAQTR
jgi:UrcA family protein